MLCMSSSATCKVCGEPASRRSSDRRYGTYCSTRCRMIGVRYWGLFTFIVLLLGAIIAFGMAFGTDEWFLPLYFILCSLIPLGAFIFGRKFHREDKMKVPQSIIQLTDQSFPICPNCKETIQSGTVICNFCGYDLNK